MSCLLLLLSFVVSELMVLEWHMHEYSDPEDCNTQVASSIITEWQITHMLPRPFVNPNFSDFKQREHWRAANA